jgi:hypothetical protein
VIDPWAPMLSPAQLAALGGTTTPQSTSTSAAPATQQRQAYDGHAHDHNDAPHQQQASAARVQAPADAPAASASSTGLYKTTMVADPWGSLSEDGGTTHGGNQQK